MGPYYQPIPTQPENLGSVLKLIDDNFRKTNARIMDPEDVRKLIEQVLKENGLIN